MDAYAFSPDRAYAAAPPAHHVSVATVGHFADPAFVNVNYGLHYDYPGHPVYSHDPYAESMYIQPQHTASYSFPPTATSPPATSEVTYSGVPLHAPVPLSPYSTLISPVSPLSQPASDGAPDPHAESTDAPASPASSPPAVPSAPPASPASGPGTRTAPLTAEQSPLEYYGSAPQVMFPTPSELLTELSARDATGTVREPSRKASVSGLSRPSDDGAPAAPGKTSKGKSSESAVPLKPQSETQRKAYFRRVAEAVGFTPTDPDSITSHDKKRSYLECLEQYVQWLHEQIRLVGRDPLPLERVQEYRGPSSRSIRTMLVHMEDEVRELHEQTLQEERVYFDLQTQIEMQRASAAAHQLRRHSVAACGLPDTSLSSAPFLQPYPIHGASHSVQGQYQHY